MDEAMQKFIREFFGRADRQKLRKYRELNQMAEKGRTVCAGSSLMENFPINEMLMDLGCIKELNTPLAMFTVGV